MAVVYTGWTGLFVLRYDGFTILEYVMVERSVLGDTVVAIVASYEVSG